MKCGYVALLGQPNAGKSTLLNAIVGQKLAGVSKKPQTTRNRILGLKLVEEEEAQIVFLDSPGLHKDKSYGAMNKMMNDEAWAIASEADIICYLIDITKKWDNYDRDFLRKLVPRVGEKHFMVLLTKVDSIKKDEVRKLRTEIKIKLKALYKELEYPESLHRVKMLSAKRPDEVESFSKNIAKLLPEGPWLYDADDLSDRPEKFFISEYIREQIFRHLGKELPYGIGVVVEEVQDKPHGVNVKATIVVSRDTHKGIVIGAKGAMIKQLGIDSRKTLEKYYEKKVNLELFVSVKEDWTERKDMISHIQDLDND